MTRENHEEHVNLGSTVGVALWSVNSGVDLRMCFGAR
jgi:hypothetical protein